MVWCAQADKILSFLFVFAGKKFDVIQLPRTQIRALVNNYMQRGTRAYGSTYRFMSRGEPEKRSVVGSLIYLHEILLYVSITYH
jgi:hypothetical protein